VAEPDSVRSKRARQHKAGDHTLCKPDRCQWAPDPSQELDPWPLTPAPARRTVDPSRVPDKIEEAVTAFVETLPYVEPDPRALLAKIAVRLAQRVDETGALPAAVRELRVLLAQLVETPKAPVDSVDEARLRAAQRKLDIILSQAV